MFVLLFGCAGSGAGDAFACTCVLADNYAGEAGNAR